MLEEEQLARQIAARKMGLVKDRRGERLPDDLWQQALPAARRELAGERLAYQHRRLASLLAMAGEALEDLIGQAEGLNECFSPSVNDSIRAARKVLDEIRIDLPGREAD